MAQPRVPVIALAPVYIRDTPLKPVLAARGTYLDALREAGARTLVIGDLDPKAAAAYLERVDGLVLPGGWDLNPRHYGARPHAAAEPLEDDLGEFYLALARAAFEAKVPTLGICLGCQVINVALGGSLLQHLEDRRQDGVEHRAPGGGDRRHAVAIERGSRLHQAVGEGDIWVMSYHHQAVDRVAPGLKVVAHAPDGVIEGIEHPERRFFVGVQWHPERSWSEASSRRLVASFVSAAAVDRTERAA